MNGTSASASPTTGRLNGPGANSESLPNNDAALFPDALTRLLEAARADPVEGILTLPQYDWTTGDLVDRGCLLDLFYNPVPNLKSGRNDVAMAIGGMPVPFGAVGPIWRLPRVDGIDRRRHVPVLSGPPAEAAHASVARKRLQTPSRRKFRRKSGSMADSSIPPSADVGSVSATRPP